MTDAPAPTLETPRLLLRPLTLEDAPDIFRLYTDEETMRYMPTRPHFAVEETARALAGELAQGARYWAVRLKGSEEALGYAGFMGATRVPGMGYILRRDHWGKGITTEAVRAALEYGFRRRALPRVELWINESNAASLRVAEKLGFRLKGRVHQRYAWEARHHIMLVYGMRASEWGDAAAPAPSRPTSFFGLQPVLLVPDVARTVAYYTGRLGFDLDFLFGDPPEHAGVAGGDWSPEAGIIQFAQAPPGTGLANQGWLYVMTGAEIDALHASYVAQGIEILRPPQTYPWGMREFSIRDLNGYQLRFGTHHFGG